MLAKIFVTLKKGVHDPQGEAVHKALQSMHYKEVAGVRVGKYIEVKLKDLARGDAEERLKDMCEKLLANTVIEGYSIEFQE